MNTLTVTGINPLGRDLAAIVVGLDPAGVFSDDFALSLMIWRPKQPDALGEPVPHGFLLTSKSKVEPWHTMLDGGKAVVLKEEPDAPIGADHIIAVIGKKMGRLNLAACGTIEELPPNKPSPATVWRKYQGIL